MIERLRARNPLPPGAGAVGASLIVASATSYGFLVVSARALGGERHAPLSALWALVIFIGPGAFLPIEQEVSRALAARRAEHLGGRPLVLRAAVLGSGLLAVLLLVTAATGSLLTDRLFDGSVWLTVAFALSLVGYAAAHLVKGTLSGTRRFGGYARFTAGESSVRFIACAGLAWVGVTAAGPYGLCVGLAPLIGVGLALLGERKLLEPGPPAPWSELWTALGALLAGSIFSFGLVNLGPLAVKVLATDAETAAASRFLVALVVARVPLYLFQAVQAALLPRLSELATLGDLTGFRDGLGRLLLLVGGIGAAGAVAAGTVGPTVVEMLFGSDFEIGARTLALLSVSSALFMVATAIGQANIALGGHAPCAVAWGAGVAGFLASVGPASQDLFLRVEVASLVGCGAALAAQAWVLRAQLRGRRPVEAGNLLEAIVDHPLAP